METRRHQNKKKGKKRQHKQDSQNHENADQAGKQKKNTKHKHTKKRRRNSKEGKTREFGLIQASEGVANKGKQSRTAHGRVYAARSLQQASCGRHLCDPHIREEGGRHWWCVVCLFLFCFARRRKTRAGPLSRGGINKASRGRRSTREWERKGSKWATEGLLGDIDAEEGVEGGGGRNSVEQEKGRKGHQRGVRQRSARLQGKNRKGV